MAGLEIVQLPCLEDNYAFLLRDLATGRTASIDSPDPDVINAALAARGWALHYIFNTHHHTDHAGGNLALKERWGCQIVGAAADADRLPGLDSPVRNGDTVTLGNCAAQILATPGHTRAHICYWFAEDAVVFVGDTLFALGCGRLFEGTPAQMHASLERLAALPDDTRVYCAHEYTAANARFAMTLEPGNRLLQARLRIVEQRRARGEPTVPTFMGLERQTNPFLRPASVELRQSLGLEHATDTEVFAETRRRKDGFRG